MVIPTKVKSSSLETLEPNHNLNLNLMKSKNLPAPVQNLDLQNQYKNCTYAKKLSNNLQGLGLAHIGTMVKAPNFI